MTLESTVLTESEAFQKRCPVYQAQNGPCVASKCMAWRWVAADPRADQRVVSFPKGYCGLGGLPTVNREQATLKMRSRSVTDMFQQLVDGLRS